MVLTDYYDRVAKVVHKVKRKSKVTTKSINTMKRTHKIRRPDGTNEEIQVVTRQEAVEEMSSTSINVCNFSRRMTKSIMDEASTDIRYVSNGFRGLGGVFSSCVLKDDGISLCRSILDEVRDQVFLADHPMTYKLIRFQYVMKDEPFIDLIRLFCRVALRAQKNFTYSHKRRQMNELIGGHSSKIQHLVLKYRRRLPELCKDNVYCDLTQKEGVDVVRLIDLVNGLCTTDCICSCRRSRNCFSFGFNADQLVSLSQDDSVVLARFKNVFEFVQQFYYQTYENIMVMFRSLRALMNRGALYQSVLSYNEGVPVDISLFGLRYFESIVDCSNISWVLVIDMDGGKMCIPSQFIDNNRLEKVSNTFFKELTTVGNHTVAPTLSYERGKNGGMKKIPAYLRNHKEFNSFTSI
jgi:hypothetical protein